MAVGPNPLGVFFEIEVPIFAEDDVIESESVTSQQKIRLIESVLSCRGHRHGFRIVNKDMLPQKIWADCIKCIKFPNCDETAVLTELDREAAT